MKRSVNLDVIEAIDELYRIKTWVHAANMAVSGMERGEDANALLTLNDECSARLMRVLEMLEEARGAATAGQGSAEA